ncbi:MAG: response regulator [bacterium]
MSTRQTILLVEDISKLLEYRLEDEGYNVLCAYDVESGLSIIDEKRDLISLVCLDIILPKSKDNQEIDDQGGFKIAKHIPKSIPFIFISVYERSSEILEGERLGVRAFFTKPYDTLDVVNKIKEILRNE